MNICLFATKEKFSLARCQSREVSQLRENPRVKAMIWPRSPSTPTVGGDGTEASHLYLGTLAQKTPLKVPFNRNLISLIFRNAVYMIGSWHKVVLHTLVKLGWQLARGLGEESE